MKQRILILLLVFSILLLTGCNNLSTPKETMLPSEADTTLPSTAETTLPSTAETTDPTDATDSTPPTTDDPATATTEPTTAPVSTEPSVTDHPAAAAGFDAVYSDICRLLDTGSWDLEYTYANVGMMEVVNNLSTKEERYERITYALEDINNDGILEMIVLDAMGNTRILAIFTLQNNQPVMTHEGTYRARLYRLSDGALYSEGSGGAAYSIFEAYGQRWFTYPKDEEYQQIGFYYAADGSYDPTQAQEITADEYNAKQAELAQMIAPFRVYSFN